MPYKMYKMHAERTERLSDYIAIVWLWMCMAVYGSKPLSFSIILSHHTLAHTFPSAYMRVCVHVYACVSACLCSSIHHGPYVCVELCSMSVYALKPLCVSVCVSMKFLCAFTWCCCFQNCEYYFRCINETSGTTSAVHFLSFRSLNRFTTHPPKNTKKNIYI